MSDPLLRAWKVVANPDASEAQWLSACRLIGDKKPPMAVLASEGICGLLTNSERNRRLYLRVALLTGRLGAFFLDGLILGMLLAPVVFCWLAVGFPVLFNPGFLAHVCAESFAAGIFEQLVMIPTMLASISLLSLNSDYSNSLFDIAILVSATALLSLVYHVVLHSSPLQGTIGERLFGLKVTDINGRNITVARATVRHFARILCPLSFGFAYFLPLINLNQNSIEDIVSGTRVKSLDEEKMREQELSLFPYSSEIQSST